MQTYSAWSLFKQGLAGHTGWKPAWRTPTPNAAYDAVIIGGGGHGLATAYYMAKLHGMSNIAVIEKGWIGGGNSGRNTTIIRSNYLEDASAAIYEHSLKLWEGLGRELNYNIMMSHRGVHEPRARRGRGARAQAPDRGQPAERHRHRMAGRQAGEGFLPDRSTSRRKRATRCSARRCSGAAASTGMTPWSGGMRGPPTRWASTSSRTAKSPASRPRLARSPA